MCDYLNANAASINKLIEKQRSQPNRYAYSNLGFGMLVAAVLSALDYSDPASLFADVISGPVGMNSSGLAPGHNLRLPKAYDSKGAPTGVSDNLLPAYYGAGGVYTTSADLFCWLEFSMGQLMVSSLSTLLPFLQQQPLIAPPSQEPGL